MDVKRSVSKSAEMAVPVEAKIPGSRITEMAPVAAQVSVLRIKHTLIEFLGLRNDDRLKLVTEVIASMESWTKHAAQQRDKGPEKADAKDRSIALSEDQQKHERQKTAKDVDETVGLERILYTARARLQERGDHTAAKDEAALWKWLYEAIHAGYEIVDVLEERNKTKKMAKPNALLKKKKKKVSSSISSYLASLVKKTRRRDESAASKLKEINGRLESLLKEANTSGYYHYYSVGKEGFENLVTNSQVHESEVYCHKVDKKSVLEQLLPGTGEEDDRVKVVSIVGCGGSGKTMLAKSVFNDPLAEQHFKLRVWVSVSNSFDEKRLAQDILCCTGKGDVKELELESALLFQQIQGCFFGKVVLCVLDDVWNDYESSKWVRFASMLRNGAPGSRILVTTRSERFAQVVGSDWVHNLKPLSNSDWWLIWRDRLVLSERNKISKKMVDIGSKIAEKCEGSPLLAVALAQILINKNTAQEWEGELRNLSEMGDEIWKMEYVAWELFRHFNRSYPKLSKPLKLCILHCADFEKGTVIIVDQLIRMWMAQGYLGDADETDEAKTLKGLEYFNELASQSFFQDFVRGSIHKNVITSCKLNHTFHDFVRHMACHNLLKFGKDKHSTVQEKRREGYFDIKLHAGGIPQDSSGWERWKHVKALVLSSSHLKRVPGEVGILNHVQYLDLSNNPIKELPETICNLHFLEHLDVHRCYLLLCLPGQIGNLNQIKHLRVDHTTEELHKNLPKGFEKLTLIRTLDVFRAGGIYTDAIKKLKGFIHLIDICITIHGEVKFSDADLHSKCHLANLELCFVGEGRDEDKASKSMKDLKPPPTLQMLKFENYPLNELPSWILEHPLINNLTRLSLKSAWNITSFPALWMLSSLEFLWLYDISNLKRIGREFLGLPDKLLLHTEEKEDDEVVVDYVEDEVENTVREPGDHFPFAGKTTAFCSLKTLRIECMRNLDEWEDLNEDEEMVNGVTVMPSLEELIIARCPKFEPQALPLRILGDTPWFKITKSAQPPYQQEEREAAVESVLPIPITSSDKDSYMKLRKSVRDAYIIKGLTYHFEVSIPEGVFGNAEVKSRLSLKDLCQWFEPDGWVFAEQLSIWSKLVYELMTTADKKRVQMVSSDLITTVGRTEEQRAEDLVNFMTINKAELYLVPYLTPDHWELLAIVPEIGVTYRLDSLHGDIKTELTQFLKRVERSYVNKSPDSNKLLDSWRTVHIKHKKQTGNWECGYYVMIWIHKIAVKIQSLDLELHFPVDDSPYKPHVLEELAHIWCAYILPSLVHPEAEAV